MNLIALKDMHPFVCLNFISLFHAHELFIVYLEFFADFSQHACALCFSLQRQNYEFNEIETWVCLIALEDFYLLE